MFDKRLSQNHDDYDFCKIVYNQTTPENYESRYLNLQYIHIVLKNGVLFCLIIFGILKLGIGYLTRMIFIPQVAYIEIFKQISNTIVMPIFGV
jgi:hypothetical protein